VAFGVILSLVFGGRPRNLAGKTFGWWGLLPLGLALQVVLERHGVPAAFALLIVSYVCLLVFAAANLRHPGMGVVLIGIALNFVVIAANHGMPVRESAVAIASGSKGRVPAVIDEVKHRPEGPTTRLRVLGDTIPLDGFREVVSFGDLIMAVGIIDLLVHLGRPPVRKRASGRERHADGKTAIDISAIELIDLTLPHNSYSDSIRL
jgi:hypothetical protein